MGMNGFKSLFLFLGNEATDKDFMHAPKVEAKISLSKHY